MREDPIAVQGITLLEEVGRGDGGIVYRAERDGQAYWVKVPTRDPVGSEVRLAQFTTDALTLARINPQGLPRILKVSGAPEAPYVVMEGVAARPLSKHLKAGLRPAQRLCVAHQIAGMVAQLHSLGFGGLDLSANQLLFDEKLGQAYLLDRGRLTRKGTALATSHEQRADLRSLINLLRTCVGAGDGRADQLGAALDRLESGNCSLSDFVEMLSQRPATTARRSDYPPPSITASPPPAEHSARDAITDLHAAFHRARRGESVVVELVGPTGAGKSHTLDRFVGELDEDGIMVLSGDCRDSDWMPFAVLRRMFTAHMAGAARLPPAQTHTLRDRLTAASGDSLPWLSMLFPELANLAPRPAPAPREGDTQHLFVECVADFLLAYLQSCAPSVLVVDDFQWLDSSSRKVLSKLFSQLDKSGLLVIIGRRSTAQAAQLAEKVLRGRGCRQTSTVSLEPLSLSETTRIVQVYLGVDQTIDQEAIDQLRKLSDGTPLTLTNLLNRALVGGILTPAWGQWTLDSKALAQTVRTHGTDSLAAHGISSLPQDSQDVLAAVALAATNATPPLLARALDQTVDQVEATLRVYEGQRLVLRAPSGYFRMVHDSLREALDSRMTSEGRAQLHLRLAAALEEFESVRGDAACEVARHLSAAGPLADARHVLEVALVAADYARGSYDDARALTFFVLAEQAAGRAGMGLSRETLSAMGETCWQNGQIARCLELYEKALLKAAKRRHRAPLLSRMAWVYHYAGQADRSMECLAEAFTTLGRPLPKSAAVSLRMSTGAWMAARLASSVRPSLVQSALEEQEVRCALYVGAFRLYMERGLFKEAIFCAMEGGAIAAALPASRTSLRALSSVAGLLALLGAPGLGLRVLDNVQAHAQTLGDPVALTRCLTVRHTSAAWLGDTASARSFAHESAVERGAFMDAGDYCVLCLGMHVMETVLGQPSAALLWLERLVDRATLHGQAPPVVGLVEEAAKGTLTTLNREHELARLQRSLEEVQSRALEAEGFPLLLSYQFRIMQLAELGALGSPFEELVDAFSARVTDGHLKHPMACATYVHIMQARIHQGLRAGESERKHFARKLLRSLVRAKPRARGDVAKSHTTVAEAAYCWLSGDEAKATKLLATAESLAQHGPCVWVLFTVARLRAHILRERGWHASALEQARVAALFARMHGHQNRYGWIIDDFGPDAGIDNSPRTIHTPEGAHGPADPGIQRHLNALLTISRTGSSDLSPQRQAAIILEEVVQSLDAGRGKMLLKDEHALNIVASHQAEGGREQGYSSWLAEAVYGSGQVLRLEPSSSAAVDSSGVTRPTLAAPLVLRGKAIGVIYLDRRVSKGSFSHRDGELLLGLASQVPVALELAKSLREREGLETHLRQAQKMEAIGQLAGGIAHDFNNLLATVQIAGGTLSELLADKDVGKEELEDILDVAQRGGALTRQLLTFARREAAVPRALDLNEVVTSMMPMLSRLVGKQLRIENALHAPLPAILADGTQVEQVILNLVTNARDAIADEGHILVRTRQLSSDDAQEDGLPPDAEPGDYVVLEVHDDGRGMSADVQQRVFEPFFSTKPGHLGTGLGLSTVYGIVKQFEGHIQIQSKVSEGATFSVYWPAMAERVASSPQPEDPQAYPGGQETVLIAASDAVFARATERALTHAGYDVLSASGRDEVLETFEEMGGAIDLLIGDGHMTKGDNLTLLEELLATHRELRILLISGDPTAAQAKPISPRLEFLLKPFPAQTLATRIRDLLDTRDAPN